jgi:hypothetical protein
VTAAASAANFADKDAGNGKTVTVAYSLSDGSNGGAANNYSLADTTATAAITPKTLQLSGLSGSLNSKVYDGNTSADVSGLTPGMLAGIAYGSGTAFDGKPYAADSIGLNGVLTGTYNSANVAGANTVTYGGMSLSNNTAGNYVLATQTATSTITPKSLTVSGSKVYDRSTAVAFGDMVISGNISGQTIALTGGVATTSSVDVGTYSGATLSGLTASYSTGAIASNYSLPVTTGDLVVTPRPITVGNLTVSNKTYNGLATATIDTSAATYTGLISGDDVSVSILGANFASANAGTHNVILSSNATGASVSNYSVVAPGSLIGTINPAPVTVTADAKSMTYGGSVLPALTYTSSGLLNSDTFSGALSTTATAFNGTAGSGSNAGMYQISQNTLSAGGNYVISYTGANLTVNKAQLSVTGNSTSMTYGANTLPGLSAAISGYVNGDASPAGLVGSPTSSTTAMPYNGTAAGSASNVGTYPVTASVAGMISDNYTFVPVAGGTLTVNPATLTYTAATATSTYGTTPIVNAGTLSGLVNGDSQGSATSGSLNFTTTATATSGVGSYAVTGGGLTANSNYTLVQAGGNTTALTINPATLTVTADAKTMTYGGNALPSLTYAASGLVNGDAFSGALATTARAYNGTVPGSNAGTYAISQGSLTAGSNYTISYTGANLTVNKAVLSVTGNSPSMTYGASLPTLSAAYGGYVNGDSSAAGLVGSPTVTTTATAFNGTAHSASDVGTYAVTPSVTGMSSTNYTFAPFSGTLTVNRAPITVNGLMVTGKVYDATTTAAINTSGISYAGLLNGDAVNVNITGANFASANAGTQAVSLTSTVSGAQAGNYTVSAPGSLSGTITPAALTIAANDQSKTYDGLGHTAGVTYTGFVGGQSASVLTGSLNLAGVSTYDGVSVYNGAVTPGSYDVTPAGLSSTNYNISYATGLLTIDPAPLTVTARNATKVLDSVPYRGGNGVDFAGFVNGENQSALSGAVTYTGSSQNASRVGTFNIVPGGLTSTNYVLSFVNGKLTITAKPATDNLAATALTTVAPVPAGTVQNGTTGKPQAVVVVAPVIPIPTTSAAAAGLGGFKVVGSTQPNVLDVVFVPNPATPQNVIDVVQLPLSTGQGTVPDKVVNALYVAGGVVTAPAAAASSATASAAAGSSGSDAPATAVTSSVASVGGAAGDAGSGSAAGSADAVQLSLSGGQGAGLDKVVNDLLAAANSSGASTTSGGATDGSATDSTSTSAAGDAKDNTKKTNVRVEQSQITTVLANDAPLPTQLVFNPENKTFTIAQGADIKLPLQVKIQLRQGGSVVSEKLVMLTKEF